MWHVTRPYKMEQCGYTCLEFVDKAGNEDSIWMMSVTGQDWHCQRWCRWQQTEGSIWSESVPKIIINDTINLFSKTAIIILVISNHNRFWLLFDEIALLPYILFEKHNYLYFSIGNGQPRDDRHTRSPIDSSFIWSSRLRMGYDTWIVSPLVLFSRLLIFFLFSILEVAPPDAFMLFTYVKMLQNDPWAVFEKNVASCEF